MLLQMEWMPATSISSAACSCCFNNLRLAAHGRAAARPALHMFKPDQRLASPVTSDHSHPSTNAGSRAVNQTGMTAGTVLVTGASGYAAQFIVRDYEQRGWRVSVFGGAQLTSSTAAAAAAFPLRSCPALLPLLPDRFWSASCKSMAPSLARICRWVPRTWPASSPSSRAMSRCSRCGAEGQLE